MVPTHFSVRVSALSYCVWSQTEGRMLSRHKDTVQSRKSLDLICANLENHTQFSIFVRPKTRTHPDLYLFLNKPKELSVKMLSLDSAYLHFHLRAWVNIKIFTGHQTKFYKVSSYSHCSNSPHGLLGSHQFSVTLKAWDNFG